MTSKACSLLFPQTVACSDNGQCNTTLGECECEVGWTSLGDFAIVEGADCDINILEVQVLWGIVVVFASLSLVTILRYFHLKFSYNWSAFENKTLKELAADPMVMFPIWYFVFSVSLIVVGLLRILFTKEKVTGSDFGVTFFMCLALMSLMLSGAPLVKAFSKFLANSVKVMSEAARERVLAEGEVIANILPFFNVVTVLVCVIIIPIVWYPNLLPIFCGIHFFGYAFLAFLIGYMIIAKALSPVIDELQGHVTASAKHPAAGLQENFDQIKAFIRKLKVAIIVHIPAILLGGGSWVLFGSWPYMQRKTSYLFPLAFAASAMCNIIMILGVTNFKKKSSSSSHESSKPKKVVPEEGGTSEGPSDVKFAITSPVGTSLDG